MTIDMKKSDSVPYTAFTRSSRADIEQTPSKCIQNTCANCLTSARYLLDGVNGVLKLTIVCHLPAFPTASIPTIIFGT